MTGGIWTDERYSALPSLAVAAHELKNPITLMRQLSLMLGDASLSPDERVRYQQQLIAIADGALRLTTDLTQVAHLHPTLFPVEPVNPLAVCRDVAVEMRAIEQLQGRRVSWPRSSRQATLAVANQQLLKRVIINFVDNALRYTDDTAPVAVSVRRRADAVQLRVRDYGPQMNLREYRRLVDEMEQVKTVKTRPDSTGLGIFIASEFARAMQGVIGMIRHRDGVTFYVELPISGQLRLL